MQTYQTWTCVHTLNWLRFFSIDNDDSCRVMTTDESNSVGRHRELFGKKVAKLDAPPSLRFLGGGPSDVRRRDCVMSRARPGDVIRGDKKWWAPRAE